MRVQEEVGPHSKELIKTCEILEEHDHGNERSYWIRDVETNKVYVHAKDKLKQKQGVFTAAKARQIKVKFSNTLLKES